MEWQPIETAPKDGTEFLVPYPVWGPDNDTPIPTRFEVIMCHWNGISWDRGGWALHETPQVWMPKPKPPPVETWTWK